MAKHKRKGATPEMNITPLIDVVFQLIIFFMLVNNIIAEQTVEMIVPNLEESRTHELGEGDHVTVSIAPYEFKIEQRKDNPLAFAGEAMYVMVGKERFGIDPTGLEGVTKELEEWMAKPRKDDSPLEVQLRADAALYYEAVAPVMGAITAAGVDTVNLVAYMPEDKRKYNK